MFVFTFIYKLISSTESSATETWRVTRCQMCADKEIPEINKLIIMRHLINFVILCHVRGNNAHEIKMFIYFWREELRNNSWNNSFDNSLHNSWKAVDKKWMKAGLSFASPASNFQVLVKRKVRNGGNYFHFQLIFREVGISSRNFSKECRIVKVLWRVD